MTRSKTSHTNIDASIGILCVAAICVQALVLASQRGYDEVAIH